MSALSLVAAVIQLAMISSDNADEIYRSYLGKVSCCHFALVSLSMIYRHVVEHYAESIPPQIILMQRQIVLCYSFQQALPSRAIILLDQDCSGIWYCMGSFPSFSSNCQ